MSAITKNVDAERLSALLFSPPFGKLVDHILNVMLR